MLNANIENDKYRDAARPAGGSLGATMNQGGSYSHPSADTLPVLMNQGPSDKRGNQFPAKRLRNLMSQ
jgi:hypothetical protein